MPTVPVVTMVLGVDGGSMSDPAGREGLAGLTADLVDEGVGNLSAIDLSDALARLGAEYNVECGPDATHFSLTTLVRFAEPASALLAEMVGHPSLRQPDFDRVRQLRLDRLAQLRDSPTIVADRAFLRILYRDHPYAHLSIGTTAALRAVTLDELRDFHRTTFRASRATLVIAGALSHDALLRIATAGFADWPGSSSSEPVLVPAPPSAPGGLVVVRRDGAAQSELRIGHLSASRDTPDYAALLVMNALLGGQFVSRLNLKLREEKGYTYGARTAFDWRRGRSPFALETSVHTAATADTISQCLTEFREISTTRPPSDRELAMAKASLTRGYPRNFETTHQVARAVAQLSLYGLPDSYFEDFIPRVNAVESADVVSAAARYVIPSQATSLIVGDYPAIAESIEALGMGDPVMLTDDEAR
jgi:predicted Zn-dependent peptidase